MFGFLFTKFIEYNCRMYLRIFDSKSLNLPLVGGCYEESDVVWSTTFTL